MIPFKKKMIYVLNYVHSNDVQHFVHVLKLLRTLEEDFGWEIVVLSEKGGAGVQIVHGIKVRYLSVNGRFSRLVSLAIALTELRSEGYGIIFIRISRPAALVASIVGKIFGMKTFYWQSTANFDLDRGKTVIRRCLDDLAIKFIIRYVTRFVTAPEYMLRYYQEFYNVPKRKLLLLYNDIDMTRFSPQDSLLDDDTKVNILFVHSLSPSKNAAFYFPHIIDRLNSLATEEMRIEIIIIGDGPERVTISDQIKAANNYLTITMLGAIPNVDIPQYLAKSDIFIMPSYREGMPRALMEAMAMGLPVVSTDAGGTRNMVGPHQNRYIVSRDDPHAFAERLAALICDQTEQHALGKENHMSIQRYATPKIAEMYHKAFMELL